MSQAQKRLYTTRVQATGSREGGTSRSDYGRLEFKHFVPGASGNGTNPEQLFAAGWSTCYESAMAIATRKMKASLPAARARLNVSLPGLERDVAQSIVDAAGQLCPYAKAVPGTIDVAYTVVANSLQPKCADRGVDEP